MSDQARAYKTTFLTLSKRCTRSLTRSRVNDAAIKRRKLVDEIVQRRMMKIRKKHGDILFSVAVS